MDELQKKLVKVTRKMKDRRKDYESLLDKPDAELKASEHECKQNFIKLKLLKQKIKVQLEIKEVQLEIKEVQQYLYPILDKEENENLKASEKMRKNDLQDELVTFNKKLNILKEKEFAILEQHEDFHFKSPPFAKHQSHCSSPGNETRVCLDGIDIRTHHLRRPELVKKVMAILETEQFVLLSSPSASGKTSLLEIIQDNQDIQCIYISCNSPNYSRSEVVAGKGYDTYLKPYTLNEIHNKCIVMLDDAQTIYYDKPFWSFLIKVAPVRFPSNIQFIISATHMLAGGVESPVEFQSLKRLGRDDFLLSDGEAELFLTTPQIGLPSVMSTPNLVSVIIRECAGLIGALRISVRSLVGRFVEVPLPSEVNLLSYILSSEFLEPMSRCFGSKHSTPIQDNFKIFLTKLFLDQRTLSPDKLDDQDQKSFTVLQKGGLLLERHGTFEFTSPIARRYFSKWLFPNRSLDLPASIVTLVLNVIENMSASVLRQSTVGADHFPKEATFQILCMQGLEKFTPPTVPICPELSQVFPSAARSSTSKIQGEIDFYLNGSLRWGIELLVNGIAITEHLHRFRENGKYFPLGMEKFVVVDFRGNESGEITNVTVHPNRITVFFKNGDFSECKCLCGLDKNPVTLHLQA